MLNGVTVPWESAPADNLQGLNMGKALILVFEFLIALGAIWAIAECIFFIVFPKGIRHYLSVKKRAKEYSKELENE